MQDILVENINLTQGVSMLTSPTQYPEESRGRNIAIWVKGREGQNINGEVSNCTTRHTYFYQTPVRCLKGISGNRDTNWWGWIGTTRARLGRLEPLGRPRSVYNSDVECRFVSWNDPMASKVKVNASYFNTRCENPNMHICCKFGDSNSNSLQVIARTSRNSWNSATKWPQWPCKSRSMTSIFNTNREYPRMHVWCKFGDSRPNLWRVAWTSQIS